jgi:hypothetical protein
VIAVRAASFRSLRGLTCVAAVADEIAFWQCEDGSANPDVEILRAVRPTLLTTRGPCAKPTSIAKWIGTRRPAWPNTTPSSGPTFLPLSARKSSTVALRVAYSNRRRPPTFVSRIRRSVGRRQRCDDTGDRPSCGRHGRSRRGAGNSPLSCWSATDGRSRSPLSTSLASTVCRRRCCDHSTSSPPSGRRAPTLPRCTALREAGRKNFLSPTSTPLSIMADSSPTSQRG